MRPTLSDFQFVHFSSPEDKIFLKCCELCRLMSHHHRTITLQTFTQAYWTCLRQMQGFLSFYCAAAGAACVHSSA